MTAVLEAPSVTSVNSMLSATIADLVAEAKQSLVLISVGSSHGAGVIWRSDGIIVTNRHVLGGDRVDVILEDGRKLTGIVAARHPDRDLAIVKVAATGLPAARLGDSSTVRPNDSWKWEKFTTTSTSFSASCVVGLYSTNSTFEG